MDREDWRAAIHGVAKSQMRPRDWTELKWTFFNVDLSQRVASSTNKCLHKSRALCSRANEILHLILLFSSVAKTRKQWNLYASQMRKKCEQVGIPLSGTNYALRLRKEPENNRWIQALWHATVYPTFRFACILWLNW